MKRRACRSVAELPRRSPSKPATSGATPAWSEVLRLRMVRKWGFGRLRVASSGPSITWFIGVVQIYFYRFMK